MIDSSASDDDRSIDVSDFIYMPLATLEAILIDLDTTESGSNFVIRVVRLVAFRLLLGDGNFERLEQHEAVLRGAAMLEILGRVLPNSHPD